MAGFQHQKDSPGSVPRKIASLLAPDPLIDQPLQWASSIVRAWGMSSGVLLRIITSSPLLERLTLMAVNDSPASKEKFDRIEDALARIGHEAVWRAAQSACFTSFVSGTIRSNDHSPILFAATGRASADLAHWMAGRHILNPNECFSKVLWSEVGLASNIHTFPDVYSNILTSGSRPMIHDEAGAFGFDHQTVGACVLRLYRFPGAHIRFAEHHEVDLLDLPMEEKLLRAAAVGVGSVGGWHHPKTDKPALSTAVLAGALLRESDREAVESQARLFLSSALKSLTRQYKNVA